MGIYKERLNISKADWAKLNKVLALSLMQKGQICKNQINCIFIINIQIVV